MRRTKPPANKPKSRSPKDNPQIGDIVQVWLGEAGWQGRVGRVISERTRGGRRQVRVQFGTGDRRWITPEDLRRDERRGILLVLP